MLDVHGLPVGPLVVASRTARQGSVTALRSPFFFFECLGQYMLRAMQQQKPLHGPSRGAQGAHESAWPQADCRRIRRPQQKDERMLADAGSGRRVELRRRRSL